jgi:SAM-dependent methyltransferase
MELPEMTDEKREETGAWEEVQCILCGAEEGRTYFRQGDRGQFRFIKCAECGMVYLNPRPVPSSHQKPAGQRPRDFGIDFWKLWVEKEEWAKPDKLKELQNRDSLRALARYKKPGLLLEIGLMDADFIRAAQALGWDVLWQETDALIPPIEEEPANGYIHFAPAQFDAVTIRHTLENTTDPEGLLREVNRVLKDDGVLLAELPNVESIDKHHKRILLKNKLIRQRWSPGYIPEKYYAFSAKALHCLAERAGFRTLKWRTYSNRKNHFRFVYPLLNIFHWTKLGSKMRFILGKRNSD